MIQIIFAVNIQQFQADFFFQSLEQQAAASKLAMGSFLGNTECLTKDNCKSTKIILVADLRYLSGVPFSSV